MYTFYYICFMYREIIVNRLYDMRQITKQKTKNMAIYTIWNVCVAVLSFLCRSWNLPLPRVWILQVSDQILSSFTSACYYMYISPMLVLVSLDRNDLCIIGPRTCITCSYILVTCEIFLYIGFAFVSSEMLS